MSYSRPPLIVAPVFTTNAVANTATSHTVLAAPGAGLAYRVIWWSAGTAQNEAAATGIRLFLQLNISGLISVAEFVWTGASSMWGDFAEPGLLCDPNTAVIVQSFDTAASRGFNVQLHYYRDGVT